MTADIRHPVFEELETKPILQVRHWWGGVDLLECQTQPLLIARPWGFITPSIVRKDVAAMEEFATRTPSWDYIVDSKRVLLIHPLNGLVLKRVPKLPNIRRYIVAAPNPILRCLFHLGRRLGGAFDVKRNLNEALASL